MSTVQSTNPHRYEFDPASGVVFCTLDFMGFPGYRVGDDGSVWSRWKHFGLGMKHGCRSAIAGEWRRRKPGKGKRGQYRIATLYPGPKYLQVHRLVLQAFVGPCPTGMQACHDPDHDPDNNQLSNLRWDTREANFRDRDRQGRTCRGERHHDAKFTVIQVREIRSKHASGRSIASLGREYKVAPQTVGRIIRKQTWKHVTDHAF